MAHKQYQKEFNRLVRDILEDKFPRNETRLNFYDKGLNDDDIAILFNALEQNTRVALQIKIVVLYGNILTITPNVTCLINLKILNLAHNQLKIAPDVSKCLLLTDLALHGNPIVEQVESNLSKLEDSKDFDIINFVLEEQILAVDPAVSAPIDLKLAYKEAKLIYKEAKRAVKDGELTAIEAKVAEKLQAKRMAKKATKFDLNVAASETTKTPKQLRSEARKAQKSELTARAQSPSSIKSLSPLESPILVESKTPSVNEIAAPADVKPLSKNEEFANRKAKNEKKLHALQVQMAALETKLALLEATPVSTTALYAERESLVSRQQKLACKELDLISMNSKLLYREHNLSSPQLGKAKSEAHKEFDLLWQKRAEFFNINKNMARNDSYKWLSKMLKIPFSETHMSLMDIATCKETTRLCKITLGLWAQVTNGSGDRVLPQPPLLFSGNNVSNPSISPINFLPSDLAEDIVLSRSSIQRDF